MKIYFLHLQQILQQRYLQQQQLQLQQQQQQQQQLQQLTQQQPQSSIYARQGSDPMASKMVSSAASESIYQRQLSASAALTSQLQQQQQQQSQYGVHRKMSQPQNQQNVPIWVPKNYIERVTAIYDYAADKVMKCTLFCYLGI